MNSKYLRYLIRSLIIWSLLFIGCYRGPMGIAPADDPRLEDTEENMDQGSEIAVGLFLGPVQSNL